MPNGQMRCRVTIRRPAMPGTVLYLAMPCTLPPMDQRKEVDMIEKVKLFFQELFASFFIVWSAPVK